jgi:hypothetical protein
MRWRRDLTKPELTSGGDSPARAHRHRCPPTTHYHCVALPRPLPLFREKLVYLELRYARPSQQQPGKTHGMPVACAAKDLSSQRPKQTMNQVGSRNPSPLHLGSRREGGRRRGEWTAISSPKKRTAKVLSEGRCQRQGPLALTGRRQAAASLSN